MIMIIILCLVLSFNRYAEINLATLLISLILLFISGVNPKKAVITFSGALLIALSLFMSALYFTNNFYSENITQTSLNLVLLSTMSGGLYNAFSLSSRIMAYAGLGILFVLTTSSDDLIASMILQLHIPPAYAYGVQAAFNVTESLKREYDKVKLAFRVRGVKLSMFSLKPLFVMLVNSLHWSVDMAMAMESKGFDGSRERTYYTRPVIQKTDYVFITLSGIFSIFIIYINLL